MEWAAQFPTDDESFGQRGMVVRATRSDSEKFVVLACQNYVLVPDFASDHSAILQTIDRISLCEIRSICAFHGSLLPSGWSAKLGDFL
jgi:hypothetical protein